MHIIKRTVPLILIVLLTAGCASVITFETESRPLDRAMIIDGNDDDWSGNLYTVEGERVSLGLFNDQEYLYVCLSANDITTVSQVMRQGLTVWFDAEGGRKKTLGIKYPDGSEPGADKADKKKGDGRKADGEHPSSPPKPRDDWSESGFDVPPENMPREVEIIRAGVADNVKMGIEDIAGFAVRVRPTNTSFVYELRIPLVQTAEHPVAVGIIPGKTLGIGFETGKLSAVRGPKDGSPGAGPTGMPGGGSGGNMPPMGGSGGMGPGGGMGQGVDLLAAKRLKIWATARLSSSATVKPAAVSSVSKIN